MLENLTNDKGIELSPTIVNEEVLFSLSAIANYTNSDISNIVRKLNASELFSELKSSFRDSKAEEFGSNSLLPLNLTLHVITGLKGLKSERLRLEIIDYALEAKSREVKAKLDKLETEKAELFCQLEEHKAKLIQPTVYTVSGAIKHKWVPLSLLASELNLNFSIVKATALKLGLIKVERRERQVVTVGENGHLVDAGTNGSTVVVDMEKAIELILAELNDDFQEL